LAHFVSAIDAYCRDHRLRLVLLLDEVDSLLSADEQHDHIFLSTLRALINQAGVKVLVAGYRTLFHQLFSDNSPLSSIFQPIVLSALDRRDAFALVEEPLRPIFTIEHADIDCILDKTACHPSYIQFFCERLVSHAFAQGQRTISRSDITYVADSQELYDFMVDVYLKNLDEKARTLLYLMAAHYDRGVGRIIVDRNAHESATMSKHASDKQECEIGATFMPDDLHRLLELHGVILTPQQVEDLMRDMVLAQVLRQEDGPKKYSFILSDLPAIMSKHREVELVAAHLLERVERVFGKEK
jgi:hypothetical protein